MQSQPSTLDSECLINTFKALYTSRLTKMHWSTGADNDFIRGVIRHCAFSFCLSPNCLLSADSLCVKGVKSTTKSHVYFFIHIAAGTATCVLNNSTNDPFGWCLRAVGDLCFTLPSPSIHSSLCLSLPCIYHTCKNCRAVCIFNKTASSTLYVTILTWLAQIYTLICDLIFPEAFLLVSDVICNGCVLNVCVFNCVLHACLCQTEKR